MKTRKQTADKVQVLWWPGFDPRAFWWATPTPMFHWFTLTPATTAKKKGHKR